MAKRAELEAEANALLFVAHEERDFLTEDKLRRYRQREVSMGNLGGFRCRSSSDLMVDEAFDASLVEDGGDMLVLRAMGYSYRRLAEEFGCCRATAARAVRAARPAARDRIAAIQAFVDDALRRH